MHSFRTKLRKKTLMRVMAALACVYFFAPFFFEEQISRLTDSQRYLYALVKILSFGLIFWTLMWMYNRADQDR